MDLLILSLRARATTPRELRPFIRALYKSLPRNLRGRKSSLILSPIPEGQQFVLLQTQPPFRREVIVSGVQRANVMLIIRYQAGVAFIDIEKLDKTSG